MAEAEREEAIAALRSLSSSAPASRQPSPSPVEAGSPEAVGLVVGVDSATVGGGATEPTPAADRELQAEAASAGMSQLTQAVSVSGGLVDPRLGDQPSVIARPLGLSPGGGGGAPSSMDQAPMMQGSASPHSVRPAWPSGMVQLSAGGGGMMAIPAGAVGRTFNSRPSYSQVPPPASSHQFTATPSLH